MGLQLERQTNKALISSSSSGYIYANVVLNESHSLVNEVPEVALEDGTILTTTVVQKPITVSITFEQTNTSDGIASPQLTFEKIFSIWENRELVDIITEHRLYQNAILVNAPILHRTPYKNSLQISCDFKIMNFEKVDTFEFQNAVQTNGIDKSAAEIKDTGDKQATNLNNISFSDDRRTGLAYLSDRITENTENEYATLSKLKEEITNDQYVNEALNSVESLTNLIEDFRKRNV